MLQIHHQNRCIVVGYLFAVEYAHSVIQFSAEARSKTVLDRASAEN